MNKRRVLMIEDDLDDRYITQTYFADFGSSIALRFFDSHNDVIQYLDGLDRSELPELIVFDPGKRGNQTLEQLKSHPRFREIPVVVVSEITHPATVKEAYRLGANSYVVKPPTAEQLLDLAKAFKWYWLHFNEFDAPTLA